MKWRRLKKQTKKKYAQEILGNGGPLYLRTNLLRVNKETPYVPCFSDELQRLLATRDRYHIQRRAFMAKAWRRRPEEREAKPGAQV